MCDDDDDVMRWQMVKILREKKAKNLVFDFS